MTTSGTYAFTMNSGEVIAQAFVRIGIKRTDLTITHLTDARFELNLLGSAWANSGPSLWAFDTQTITLVPGQQTYTIDLATIMILDAWISTGSPTNDRIITSVSRSEYAGYPNKTQQGFPVVFWFDRLTAPTVTFWPVPDASQPYVFNFFRSRQPQDMVVAGGVSPELPYRWLDALIWGLSERLCYPYAMDRAQMIQARAGAAYEVAASQDTENVPMTIGLDLSSYFR